jgi:phage terminase large subunit-like protein
LGLRGPGARPVKLTKTGRIDRGGKRGPRLPWRATTLKRWERVVVFCEELTVTSGSLAGTKMKLRPFQKAFLKSVYGEDNKHRPVRTAVLSMGRKNGKSQLAAAMALCHLCGPEAEQRGEVYSCANDRFQASKIFNEAEACVLHSEFLRDRVTVQSFIKSMKDLETGSTFAALTAESRTKMGLSPSFVVYDELGSSPDRRLYDAMDTAMGARASPLMMVISTQAADDHAPMSVLIDYGKRVLNNEVNDPAFHLTLYEAPLDIDPWSKVAWLAANPALGDFRSLEDVERQAEQAQRMPSQENRFRNLILNQRIAAETRFVEREAWSACAGPAEIPDGAKVFGGVDLGSTRDMSALVLVAADANDIYHVQPHFWLPGNVIGRVNEDMAPYDVWIREGHLYHAGETTDPRFIAEKIAELNGRYRITSIAFDRWKIGDLQRELNNIGCHVTLTPHGQGFKDMSPAVDVLERLMVQRRIRHSGHPVLTWNAANAVVLRSPVGDRKLDKAKSTGRIDGLVALAMCFSLALIKVSDDVDLNTMIG